jgi:hypothetical protein
MRFAAAVMICGVLFASAAGLRAEVDQRCPGTALDRAPSLISSMDQLRHTGTVRETVIISPASLKDPQRVSTSLKALEFCPAVRYSRYAPVKANFDIPVE